MAFFEGRAGFKEKFFIVEPKKIRLSTWGGTELNSKNNSGVEMNILDFPKFFWWENLFQVQIQLSTKKEPPNFFSSKILD